jgi:hypothetical protein
MGVADEGPEIGRRTTGGAVAVDYGKGATLMPIDHTST